MPPSSHLSTSRRLDLLLERSLSRLLYSPSCATVHARSRKRPLPHTSQRNRRASTLTSSTAINGTKHVPERCRLLHDALADVQKKASAQINLSRLQLALQGLESESPPTRVAILGLNVPHTARRIARLLLADALEPEGSWEVQLSEASDNYSDGLLIRYGQPPNSSLPQSRTSIPTLHIPSNVLQQMNLEILISSINAGSPEIATNASTTSDAFLSPIIGTPTSASGRQVLISQPVHRTLVVANGLDELVSISEILASTKFISVLDRSLVSVAVNLPDTPTSTSTKTTIFDSKSAEEGLAAIRQSLSLATKYEHNWNTSGLPTLSEWLITASSSATKAALISSLLTSASANLDAQRLTSAVTASSQSLSNAARSSLENAISSFSSAAHTELQSGLSAAWSSRNWRKLAWWKLFWRVDDVGLIISDLVTNAWLPNTEKAVYELSGRLRQVGIEPVEEVVPEAVVETEVPVEVIPAKWEAGGRTIPPEVPYPSERQVHPQYSTGMTKPTVNVTPMTSSSPARAFSSEARPVLVSGTGSDVSVQMRTPLQPTALSALVSHVRGQTMAEYIASLTVTAQQLVLRTLSITGLSAGLSGLLYVTIASGSLYEAGTVVALGTAYALRRMQTDWLASCKSLEDGLMEEGRGVIKRIESRMRTLVDDGGTVVEDPIEVRMRHDAEDAVKRAQAALATFAKSAVAEDVKTE